MPERAPAPPSLVAALRQLEHDAVQDGIPPGARHRIAARLKEEAERRVAEKSTPRRWLPALTFAAGAALVMIVVGSGVQREVPVVEEAASTPRTIGVWAVEGADCREAMEGGDTVLRGDCRLVSESMSIETWNETRLHDAPGGVRVLQGAALFSVEKVAAEGSPVRVEVSHGAIEVLGTRFTVEQGLDGGHVDLFEGRIRFVGEGEVTEVQPGQRLGWGTQAREPERVAAVGGVEGGSEDRSDESVAPEEPPASAVQRRVAPATRPADAAKIIARVNALRASGRYGAAADLLRRALRRPWDRRTAEVLSYELGRILERQLHDEAAACTHWRQHEDRFGGGRYADAVARGMQRTCGE
jgi:transmembrane sensor